MRIAIFSWRRWCAWALLLAWGLGLLVPAGSPAGVPSAAKPRCAVGKLPQQVKRRVRVKRGKRRVWVTRKVWRCVPDRVPPTAPGALTASLGDGGAVTLSWSAATDNDQVMGYRISRNGQALTTVSTTSWSDPEPPAGANGYQVVSLDAAGNASSPATVSVSVPDGLAPSVPGGLSFPATHNPGGVEFSWDPSTDNVGVALYRVYRNSRLLGTTTSAWYLDTTVRSGDYSYRVAAVDAAGNASALSPSISTYVS